LNGSRSFVVEILKYSKSGQIDPFRNEWDVGSTSETHRQNKNCSQFKLKMLKLYQKSIL